MLKSKNVSLWALLAVCAAIALVVADPSLAQTATEPDYGTLATTAQTKVGTYIAAGSAGLIGVAAMTGGFRWFMGWIRGLSRR